MSTDNNSITPSMPYTEFAKLNNYPSQPSQIHPTHLLKWIKLVKSNLGPEAFDSNEFHKAFYKLVKKMDHPLSLFLSKAHVKAIFSANKINSELLVYLFDIFFSGCRLFATNLKGRDLIKLIPDVLPENRSIFPEKFLTLISNCFSLSIVIDFYQWLLDENPTHEITLNCDNLMNWTQRYRKFMKSKFANLMKENREKMSEFYFLYYTT